MRLSACFCVLTFRIYHVWEYKMRTICQLVFKDRKTSVGVRYKTLIKAKDFLDVFLVFYCFYCIKIVK